MDSFLKDVSSQIKSKKARKNVEAELKFHLNNTMDYWMAKGCSQLEAEEKAVEQMGNPIKLGYEMNKLHTPPFTLFLRPFFIHLGICLLAAILFNSMGSFDQLMMEEFSRNIIYGIQTVIVIYLYLFFGKKFLNKISNRLLIKSIAMILAINVSLALSGYLMMSLGSGIMAENGQFPIMIFMMFNYGFYSFVSSIPLLPEFLSLLVLCSVSPLLLYIGGRKGRKLVG